MHGVLQFNDSFHMWSDILLVVMVKKCQAATVGLFRHNLGFISECVSVYFPARPSFFLIYVSLVLSTQSRFRPMWVHCGKNRSSLFSG